MFGYTLCYPRLEQAISMIKRFHNPRRWLFFILLFMFLVLQYRIWFGEGSLAQKVELTRKVEQQTLRNERLEERNRILAEEVDGLRNTPEAIEERARIDLGMVKEDETFFLVLDKRRDQSQRKVIPRTVPEPETEEVEAQDVIPVELFEE